MTRLEIIVPPMHPDRVDQQVVEVAEALYQRTDEIAPVLARGDHARGGPLPAHDAGPV